MSKKDFTSILIEYYKNPQKYEEKILDILDRIQMIKMEITDITVATKNRPNILNYSLKSDKGIKEKLKYFLENLFVE